MTEKMNRIDFVEIRKSILESEDFVKLRGESNTAEGRKMIRDLDRIISILEFSIISGPYRSILGTLCSQGSGNLLRKTIRGTNFDKPFEELTKAVWASDLDPKDASSLMKDVLKDLENSHIIRFVLATHFISRVYWAKWKKSDRESFLEVAAEIMDGLDTKIDKGKVQRMIKKERK